MSIVFCLFSSYLLWNKISSRQFLIISQITGTNWRTNCCIKYTGPCVTKVPRLGMCRSIILLSKITHQMWRDQPFSQRNKGRKRAGGYWGVRRYMCGGGGGGWSKFEKAGVSNIGEVTFIKQGVRNSLLTMLILNFIPCG